MLKDFETGELSKITNTSSLFERLCSMLKDQSDDEMRITSIKSLRSIAKHRVLLTKAAEVIYQDFVEKKYENEHQEKLKELHSLVMSTCMTAEGKNLGDFFLRQFLRSYGNSILQSLVANKVLEWVWPAEGNEVSC